IPQPEPEYEPPETSPTALVPDSQGQPAATVADKSVRSHLQAIHEDGLLDFVNAKGFGYIKDRDSVAGFQMHQFHQMPGSTSKTEYWKIQRLELVSLLKFDEPAVYLSDHLPRMDELREAKTRPLDEFERRSLDALQRGHDLEVAYTSSRIRMFGSIRSL